jgi:hypothetical protein
MPAPTWREIAELLAGRIAAHADCPDHPETSAVPDRCPFCADRAVFRRFQAKARSHPILTRTDKS